MEHFRLDEEQPPVSPSIVPSQNPASVMPPRSPQNPAAEHAEKPHEKPLVIGVAGGTASGKTTVCKMVIQKLHEDHVIDKGNVVVISQDSFYRPLTPEQKEMARQNKFNFDHPAAFDFPLIHETISKLLARQPCEIPVYDFVTHSRLPDQVTHVGVAEVIILEGILILHDPSIVKLMSMKIFVDADPDVRLARRVQRDIAERGRELQGVLAQYLTFVKPAYDRYIAPTKEHADIVIQKGGENMVAINLICGHIRETLEMRRRLHMGLPPLGTTPPRMLSTRSTSPMMAAPLGTSPVLLVGPR
ncbi:putative Uridine-cytidine kinase 2-A [Paratrimastix pyriformis]|uniref:Uridine kinase n=1 Tax=Paratrimastix pyriformis TaxID=342808 RepID=A0ABQ8UTL6_9EUKA|nr:putative Uridine-cytidine kinase 2-A [Paratrimastix pyriformis]